jgi:hypothetical protein
LHQNRYEGFCMTIAFVCITSIQYKTFYREITSAVYNFMNYCKKLWMIFYSRMRFHLRMMVGCRILGNYLPGPHQGTFNSCLLQEFSRKCTTISFTGRVSCNKSMNVDKKWSLSTFWHSAYEVLEQTL